MSSTISFITIPEFIFPKIPTTSLKGLMFLNVFEAYLIFPHHFDILLHKVLDTQNNYLNWVCVTRSLSLRILKAIRFSLACFSFGLGIESGLLWIWEDS
jgi:hypothetical protein